MPDQALGTYITNMCAITQADIFEVQHVRGLRGLACKVAKALPPDTSEALGNPGELAGGSRAGPRLSNRGRFSYLHPSHTMSAI